MTGVRIVGGLFIDCGQQLKNLTWVREPRARYQCLDCHYASPVVTGAEAVARFVSTIRADHYASHHHTSQGAQAA